jgi:hypothetical protein
MPDYTIIQTLWLIPRNGDAGNPACAKADASLRDYTITARGSVSALAVLLGFCSTNRFD